MPLAAQLQHRYIRNTALPYISNASVTNTDPCFGPGSADILTSLRGFAEKRPGTAVLAASISKDIKRIFLWERWDGEFFLLVAATNATESWVYKMKIGTDSGLVALYGDVYTNVPFDFVVSNNKVFFGNNLRVWKYEGVGTTVHPVGIGMYTDPAHKPTTSLAGTGISAVNGGYQYVYCYGNSSTGHISEPSYFSEQTGNFDNKQVTITCYKTTDTQVDKLHVYRTTDGGGGIYFEITGSPFAHTPGAGTMNVTDTTEDVDLSSTTAPVPGINCPPEAYGWGYTSLVWFANRIWGVHENQVHYSGWEEVENGVEEECWPEENVFTFESKVRALASIKDGVLVFLTDAVWMITGDGVDTFSRGDGPILSGFGARNQDCVASKGRTVAWLDVGGTVYITDGSGLKEVSIPIRPDLDGINHDNSSLTFHTYGKNHWLVLSTGSVLLVYDLDTEMWMPPWNRAVTCVASGETAAGTVQLLMGDGGAVWKLTPTSFSDGGSNFTGAARLNLFDIVPDNLPGALGEAEYISLETGSTLPATVKIMTDDDPASAAYTDLTATKIDAPRRVQGTYLKENWYYARTPAARRASIQLDWAAGSVKFKLYSIDLAYKEAP